VVFQLFPFNTVPPGKLPNSPTENYTSSCRPRQWARQHFHATGCQRQDNAGPALRGGKGREDGQTPGLASREAPRAYSSAGDQGLCSSQ